MEAGERACCLDVWRSLAFFALRNYFLLRGRRWDPYEVGAPVRVELSLIGLNRGAVAWFSVRDDDDDDDSGHAFVSCYRRSIDTTNESIE